MSVKWDKLLNKLRLLFVQRGDSTNKLKQKVKNMKHLKKSTTKKITHDSTLKLGLSSCSIYISFYVVSNVVKGSRWDSEWSKLQEQEKHMSRLDKHCCLRSRNIFATFQNAEIEFFKTKNPPHIMEGLPWGHFMRENVPLRVRKSAPPSIIRAPRDKNTPNRIPKVVLSPVRDGNSS